MSRHFSIHIKTNGYCEHRHHHIVEMSLSLLSHASMSLSYWSYVFATIIYLINRMSTSTFHFSSPYVKLFRSQPDYSKFCVFGCLCYPCFIHTLHTNQHLTLYHVSFSVSISPIVSTFAQIFLPPKFTLLIMSNQLKTSFLSFLFKVISIVRNQRSYLISSLPCLMSLSWLEKDHKNESFGSIQKHGNIKLFSKNVFLCFLNSFKMILDNQLFENKVDSNSIKLQP